MSEDNSITIYFQNKLKKDDYEASIVASPNQTLVDILPDILKKYDINMGSVAIATQHMEPLNREQLHLNLKYLTERFGTTFYFIDAGDVGLVERTSKYIESKVDKYIPKFEKKWINVGPKHKAWKKRMDIEADYIIRYLDYIRMCGVEPWFKLAPLKKKKYNLSIWEGYLLVPSQSEIKFDIVVLLNTDYPKTCPRCFIDEVIHKFCGKLYVKNIWEQNGKKYIMICHDHMDETNAWQPNLGIIHFFLREICIWWMAQQNQIIKIWNDLKKK